MTETVRCTQRTLIARPFYSSRSPSANAAAPLPLRAQRPNICPLRSAPALPSRPRPWTTISRRPRASSQARPSQNMAGCLLGGALALSEPVPKIDASYLEYRRQGKCARGVRSFCVLPRRRIETLRCAVARAYRRPSLNAWARSIKPVLWLTAPCHPPRHHRYREVATVLDRTDFY